jgi:diguanylate cyclase (GGDEF)-like protein
MMGWVSGAALALALAAVLVVVVRAPRYGAMSRTWRSLPLVAGGAGALVVAAGSYFVAQTEGIYRWAPGFEALLALTAVAAVGSIATLRTQPPRVVADPPEEANVDGLTRMASHRAFQDRLEHECDRAYRFGDSFALLILDLDQFHLVNERHRHKTGDHVLTGLAGRLSGMIREIDLCARFGGDQFAIILPHTYQKGGVDAAERLRQSVAAWSFHTPENTELRLTASAGLAFYPGDGTKPAELVQAARDALAFAKSLGGNQVQVYPELSLAGEDSGNVVKLTGTNYGTVVRSLAAAVDARDPYTHSHSRLVSELSAATARRMGFRGHEVARIQNGALLHDVGKIGFPDALFTKQGGLTASEWDIIYQHPVLGKTIIEHAPELADVIPLVLHHQERFDGSGYPARLSGDAIPIGARIIAVADAYHAIRSDRPYRSARTHVEAVQELRRCAETQFDPQVVASLIAVLEVDSDLNGLLQALEEPMVTSEPLLESGAAPSYGHRRPAAAG